MKDTTTHPLTALAEVCVDEAQTWCCNGGAFKKVDRTPPPVSNLDMFGADGPEKVQNHLVENSITLPTSWSVWSLIGPEGGGEEANFCPT